MKFPSVIDNSMREAFVKCPHYFIRKYCEGWDPKLPSVHLHAGAAYAKGLEVMRQAFYDESASADAALAAGARALILAYGTYDPGDHAKSCTGMLSALTYYADNFPPATDYIKPYRAGGKSALEFTFGIPLPISHPEINEPLIYAGRFDMMAELHGALCIYDDKTATQLGKQWASRWRLASQMTGYVWAAQQFGYATNTFVVRGVSITAAGNHSHEEVIGYRNQWMIDRWYAQLLREIYRMIDAFEGFRLLGVADFDQSSACSSYGGCEFLNVCESPDPQTWLNAEFTHRDYDPLNVGD